MGFVDDYLGGYENLHMHGYDYEYAYTSELNGWYSDDELDSNWTTVFSPKAKPAQPNQRKATKRVRKTKLQASGDQAAAKQPDAAASAPGAAAPAAAEQAPATAAPEAPDPWSLFKKQEQKRVARELHHMELQEICQGKLRPRHEQYHDAAGWNVTIQLIPLLNGSWRQPWKSVCSTGTTLQEAHAAARLQVKDVVERSLVQPDPPARDQ